MEALKAARAAADEIQEHQSEIRLSNEEDLFYGARFRPINAADSTAANEPALLAITSGAGPSTDDENNNNNNDESNPASPIRNAEPPRRGLSPVTEAELEQLSQLTGSQLTVNDDDDDDDEKSMPTNVAIERETVDDNDDDDEPLEYKPEPEPIRGKKRSANDDDDDDDDQELIQLLSSNFDLIINDYFS